MTHSSNFFEEHPIPLGVVFFLKQWQYLVYLLKSYIIYGFNYVLIFIYFNLYIFYMNRCEVSTWLAYAMSIYCIASIFYYLRTRSIGTPFNDSLNKKQLEIKKKSTKTRKQIFIQGLMVGAAVLVFFQPFKKCF